MIDSHNTPPLPSHVPEFIQPFDATQQEVSSAEQTAIATTFGSFVDDMMLRFIEYVDNRNRNPGWPRNVVDLWMPAVDGAWFIEVHNSILAEEEKEGLRPYDLPNKMITLLFIDNEGHEREEYKWGLGHDEVVRREDAGDEWAALQQAKELGLDISPPFTGLHVADEEWGEALARLHAEADEWARNKELEVAMGLNKQPIGMPEFDGLVEFLLSPDVTTLSRKLA